MRVFDVNVLVLAHRDDQPGHPAARDFIDRVIMGERPFCVPTVVGAAVIRIATDPRIFHEPTPRDLVWHYLDQIRARPRHVALDETAAWPVFGRICRQYDARGNRVPDAYLAAVAVSNGATVVTADRGMSRYVELAVEVPPGL